MKQVVMIVDGFNAGRFFPECLNKRNFQCIHLISKNMLHKKYDTKQYIDNFIEKACINNTLKEISNTYKILGVIAGLESGVALAHNIAKKLNLPRNNDELVQATRDKYAMQEALNANKLPHTKSFKADNLESILSWIDKNTTYPVVVKPLDSGGSDNVYICNNENQVKDGYTNITSNKTIYGDSSSAVLVQEYLSGPEYVVNLISYKGKHFLLEIRKYHKQFFNNKHIYDYEELLDFDGELQRQLSKYATQVATAVGIMYGPSHIEIIMTEDGPKLVEIAARISGATNVEVSNEALGYNVVDLTIDSYLGNIDKVENKLLKSEMILDVATNQKGKIIAIPIKKELSKFESIKSALFKLDIGDNIVPTVSLPTSPIKFHLLNANKEKLLNEVKILKEASKKGFIVE